MQEPEPLTRRINDKMPIILKRFSAVLYIISIINFVIVMFDVDWFNINIDFFTEAVRIKPLFYISRTICIASAIGALIAANIYTNNPEPLIKRIMKSIPITPKGLFIALYIVVCIGLIVY